MGDLKREMEGLKEDGTKSLQERLPNDEKIDMRKFDDKDPVTWVLHMEQFFDVHHVQHTQKVCTTYLYLEPNQFVWYRCIVNHKPLVAWSIFM